ncbi:MAG: hypothetical protein QF845_00795 [Candidatus Marinimicrobia bacterium]|nr:hypothetical protein [Candidatus Neomarinimicrobiota bacterium]MDP7071329.1 hypothetical protein [Candidatus Neomarinimicrobiota bacterium]
MHTSLGWVLAISFGVRVVAAIFQELYHIVPYDWDEGLFLNMGMKVKNYLEGTRASLPFVTLSGVPAYGTLLGGLFFLYDFEPFLARLLSAVIGTGVVFWVYKLSEQLKLNQSSTIFISLVVGLTPSYIIYSTLIMRDVLIWLLIMVFAFLWVKSIQRMSTRYLTWGLIPALVLVPLRPQYAPLFAAAFGFVCYLFAKKTHFQFRKIKLHGIQYAFFLSGLGGVLIVIGLLVLSEIARWDNATVLEYLIRQQGWRTQGGSVYLSDLEYTSFFDVFIYLPQRFIHFTFGPFLWNGGSAQVFASGLESLIGWIFFFILIANYKILNRSLDSSWVQSIRFILMFVIINLITASIIDSNYGTAMRHRMIFMPLLFIAALSMRQTRIDLTSNS